MGMQVTSLPNGSAIVAATQHEFPREKRPPLPAEQKAAEQSELPLPNFADTKDKSKIPDLKRTTAELEHISLAFDRRLKFVIDQDSREIVIKVIDNSTDKVIKVLPPEELQRLHSRIKETIGFLFDTTV